MNLQPRLIILLMVSIVFSAPTSATVAVDVDGYCDIAADDEKGDDKKKEGEEEPDCE